VVFPSVSSDPDIESLREGVYDRYADAMQTA
jgi:hypothetical protein